MESDSSLIILDQSSSFQVLNESESFVVIESSEIASHYDVEDEWLQIETGSVISSMASIIKPDGSIMSEYSILDNMHATALNEGGKLIKTRPDIYVEDQTMRKILEYIGMFSDEVSSCLKASRSSKSLMSSQIIQEDWEISSLIDLDDISMDLLGLLLDTLEEFGMYKLCLIVCNRYNLSNRLGRYIVSLASKYSNLNEIKTSELRGGIQVQRAAIAYTAVHNVFEMINPEYLTLKESGGNNLGIDAFRGLLLLGYWKKLVYIMDFDNSLALTRTFGDFKNFKQIYLTRIHKNNFDLNKEDFDWLPFTEPKQNDNDICILALDAVVFNLNGLKAVTLNKNYINYIEGAFPVFPSYFPYNKLFWEFMLKVKNSNSLKEMLKEILPISLLILKDKNSESLQLYDIYSFYTQLIFASEEIIISDILATFSFTEFEVLLEIYNQIIIELTLKQSSSKPTRLFSILHVLGIREIIPSDVTAVYPFLTYAMINRNSSILNSMDISSNAYIPDLEANYLLVPIQNVKSHIFNCIIQRLTKLLKLRSTHISKQSVNELYEKANFFGEIFMLDFMKNQFTNHSDTLISYNYCKLNNKLLTEYKALQLRLQEIFQLGDTDYYSEIFIRIKKNAEIKKIQRRILEIENIGRGGDILARDDIILSLVNLSEKSNGKLELTKNAKLGLLTQMQTYTMLSEGESSSFIYKNMWVVYQLSRITGYTDYYLEILKSRYKRIIYHGKKFSRCSQCYETAVGFADIDVYFECGQAEEVFQSILAIFESDYKSLDMERKLSFLYKSVLSWVISNKNEFSTSLFALDSIYTIKTKENSYEINGILLRKFSPKEIIPWILLFSKELATTENLDAFKQKSAYLIYEMIFLIYKYCEYNTDIIHHIRNPENTMYLNIASEVLLHKVDFNIFYDISIEKDLQYFQKTYNLENSINIKVISRLTLKDVNAKLDNEWYLEVKRIALHHKAANKIKKIRNKFIKKPKAMSCFENMTLYYCSYSLMPIIQQLYTYYIELIDLIYRVQLKKVLDFHHVLSKFSYVAEYILQIQKYNGNIVEISRITEEIREDIQSFKSWKIAITPEIDNPNTTAKRKYKMKWPHKMRFSRKRHR